MTATPDADAAAAASPGTAAGTPTPPLAGRRVLVVGASSGIGRAVGIGACAAGATVVLAARRAALLEEAADEAGPLATPLPADVRRPADCRRVVSGAVERLGGLDAVVYSAGASPLTRVTDAGPDLWRDVVDTNLIGAALVAEASVPHLLADRGRLVLLGSSAVGRPFPGLVPYTATKAAVHELARGLRNEHPALRVTTVVVGPTLTGFADGWEPDLAGAMLTRWVSEGYLPSLDTLPAGHMAAQILHVLACDGRVDEIHVMPEAAPGAG